MLLPKAACQAAQRMGGLVGAAKAATCINDSLAR